MAITDLCSRAPTPYIRKMLPAAFRLGGGLPRCGMVAMVDTLAPPSARSSADQDCRAGEKCQIGDKLGRISEVTLKAARNRLTLVMLRYHILYRIKLAVWSTK
jgi:hypothetical protein